MTFFSSLRSRIFVTSAVLAVLSIGVAIYLVNARVTREAERTLQREIHSTAAQFDQLRATRTETFALITRFMADTPHLKAAVTTDDPLTVQAFMLDFESQLNESQLKSNLLMITNKSGRVLSRFGTPERAALAIASHPAIRDALAGRESVSLLPLPDGVLQLVTVPIVTEPSSPQILGTLSVGFLLDNALAEQLKQNTGSDIAFGIDGQILAATLPADTQPALAQTLSSKGVSTVRIGSQEYAALPRPLQPGSTHRHGCRTRRADPPVAHRAARVSRRDPHRARRHGHRRRDPRDASQLRCRADDYASAGGHHRRDARGGVDR